MRRILLLLLLPLVPALLTGWLHPRRPDWFAALHPVPQIALAALPDGALWVDAREPAVFAAGHVPGALPLSETAWEQNLPAFIDAWSPDRPVIVYCGGETCGASAACFSGGLPAWAVPMSLAGSISAARLAM